MVKILDDSEGQFWVGDATIQCRICGDSRHYDGPTGELRHIRSLSMAVFKGEHADCLKEMQAEKARLILDKAVKKPKKSKAAKPSNYGDSW